MGIEHLDVRRTAVSMGLENERWTPCPAVAHRFPSPCRCPLQEAASHRDRQSAAREPEMPEQQNKLIGIMRNKLSTPPAANPQPGMRIAMFRFRSTMSKIDPTPLEGTEENTIRTMMARCQSESDGYPRRMRYRVSAPAMSPSSKRWSGRGTWAGVARKTRPCRAPGEGTGPGDRGALDSCTSRSAMP